MSDSTDCPDAPPIEPPVVPRKVDAGPVTEGKRIQVLDVIRVPSVTVLGPMIAGVDDAREQNLLWNNAFKLFQRRLDLAAAVRMAQGRMWEAAGEPRSASQCYEDVIGRYANAGPFVIGALDSLEKLLHRAGRGERVLMLYEQAFRSIKRPQEMAGPFFRQSNFYKVGSSYVDRLMQAGMWQRAAAIRSLIEPN